MWKVRGVLYRFLYRVHGILAYPIGVFHSLGIKKAGMWVHSGLFTLISDDYFNPTLSSLSRIRQAQPDTVKPNFMELDKVALIHLSV